MQVINVDDEHMGQDVQGTDGWINSARTQIVLLSQFIEVMEWHRILTDYTTLMAMIHDKNKLYLTFSSQPQLLVIHHPNRIGSWASLHKQLMSNTQL